MNKYLLTIALLCVAGLANAQAYQKSVSPGTQNVRVRITFITIADGSDGTGLGDTEIELYYQREGEVVSADFSTGDKAALNDTHDDGTIGELGTSGVYEIDVPDTAFATASTVYIWGTASGYVCNGATVLVMPSIAVNSSGHTTPADGSLTNAKFGTGAITAGTIATNAIGNEELAASAATEIVDEFESQSTNDPSGFRVNVLQVNGTTQTAANLGSLISTLDTVADNIYAAMIRIGTKYTYTNSDTADGQNDPSKDNVTITTP